MILQPVLLEIPPIQHLTPRERVAKQSHFARLALVECARLSGAPADGWEKDVNDAPQPNQGWHWSIAHKPEMAAAVIARTPVGIDVERMQPRRAGLFAHVASTAEWHVVGGETWDAFFCVFTAKEAVLKANGCGIGGLGECKIRAVVSPDRWAISFRGVDWMVEHYRAGDHLAAVTCSPGTTVQWRLVPHSPNPPTSRFPSAMEQR